MKSHNNILDYWRTSCIDGDRMSPKDEAFRDAQNITIQQTSSGQVTETVFAVLMEQIDKKERRTRFQKADTVEEPIPVLIVPLTLRANARGGQVDGRYRTTIRPLCLPAILQPDGKLTPPQHEQPWIDRQLLEPNEQGSITLGHIDSVDTFLSQHQRPQSEQGWEAYWAYAVAMFQAVIGDRIQTFQPEGYTRASGCLVPLSVLQGSRRHIIPVYERLQGQKLPALLQRFVAGSPTEISNWLTPAQQYTSASSHTGQMTNAFPLSPSQREALHHVLYMSESDILAINGPPGTGKTTLIQSIVATLWVNAAIEGEEPPIIVAASTNNQAVQNVIASFSLATDDQAQVVERWLPEVNSFGLYCVSDSKRMDEKTAKFQYVTPAFKGVFGGSFAALENLEYLERAIPTFLSHVAIHFNRAVSLDESVTLLQQELQDATRNLSQGIATLAELTSLRERVLQERTSSAVTIASIQEQLDTARSDQRQHQHIIGLWRGLVKRDNWLKAFFDYLPPVKRNLMRRNHAFFEQHGATITSPVGTYREVETFLRKRATQLDVTLAEREHALEQAGIHERNLVECEARWTTWCNTHGLPHSTDTIAEHLDIRLRFAAFSLATHYWEARWLVEMQHYVTDERYKGSTCRDIENIWHRNAKLAPCFVSTLYMLPKFFSGWEHGQIAPLFNYIDLLIIDEAGQVSPEVAGAAFGFAKRAVVVGDKKQIEPIWSIPTGVDRGNLKLHKLAASTQEVDNFHSSGLSASKGSVMTIAQRASRYKQNNVERGMFLSEHRRCVPEIIAYCNELAYNGRLQPKRASLTEWIYPSLGFAHIAGKCQQKRGSRFNQLEATIIASWIHEQRDILRTHYHQKPLDQIIAVVTPFSAQAQEIKTALQNQGIGGITVGTVHSLQGAERDVVLFSPVYSERETFFFDRGINMLNVAVSRAKDSFLVFGDMELFEPFPRQRSGSATPSALLARYLFSDPANELTITDLIGQRHLPQDVNIHRIATLEGHRNALIDALESAQQRIVIVSPFVTKDAIQQDQLQARIQRAVERGVSVEIFTDEGFNFDKTRRCLKKDAEVGFEILRGAGAQLQVVRRIHNKTLCVDDRLIYEGSFNWLSAVRRLGDQYQNHEVSFCYSGPNVASLIIEALAQMEQKVDALTALYV